jgi:hypothetical protein
MLPAGASHRVPVLVFRRVIAAKFQKQLDGFPSIVCRGRVQSRGTGAIHNVRVHASLSQPDNAGFMISCSGPVKRRISDPRLLVLQEGRFCAEHLFHLGSGPGFRQIKPSLAISFTYGRHILNSVVDTW